MVDINQPTVLGYAITPWTITFIVCCIGIIVSVILIVLSFTGKEKKEKAMIANAVKNTRKIPVKTIDIPDGFGATGSLTESITGGRTQGLTGDTTDGLMGTNTEGLQTGGFGGRTEGLQGATEGLSGATEGLQGKTEGLHVATEGLYAQGRTAGLGCGDRTESFTNAASVSGATEGLTEDISKFRN